VEEPEVLYAELSILCMHDAEWWDWMYLAGFVSKRHERPAEGLCRIGKSIEYKQTFIVHGFAEQQN
jgi:hypothetical protein